MTVTDPTLAGLLAGVLATPENDVVRLIFADRLDELGDHERAEFIRRSIDAGLDGENGWTLQPHIRHPAKDLFRVPDLKDHQYLFRRGFVESVTCDLATFTGIAPRLFASMPVTEVKIIGDPQEVLNRFDLDISGVVTDAELERAISTALVEWSRANAERHRHGVCAECKGKRQFFAGGTFWDCESCAGTGTRPGLPPLAGRVLSGA